MDYYSAIADLINTLDQYIPDSERARIAIKANNCLLESVNLAVDFNQIATFCDRDLGDITTGLNYINLTLSEISQVSQVLTDNQRSTTPIAKPSKEAI
jgi:hypothetical protein